MACAMWNSNASFWKYLKSSGSICFAKAGTTEYEFNGIFCRQGLYKNIPIAKNVGIYVCTIYSKLMVLCVLYSLTKNELEIIVLVIIKWNLWAMAV